MLGAARVVFGADSTEFDRTTARVQNVMDAIVEKFREVERKITAIGVGLTAGVTLPFVASVRSLDKAAGDFQKKMKLVEAALPNAAPKTIKALSDAARELGPAMGKSADEAAEGIDSLARAGLSAEQILGGGLKSTLQLAAAGQTDVGNAAATATDIMGQFGITAEQLPAAVTNVVGALDASKYAFDDFAGALAQGGGVAASAGIGFTDFSTAIAAAAAQFSSGSDAGTSFKTYIQSLVPASKEAAQEMERLGLDFFDTNNKMLPLSEQAQMLRDRLRDLNDADKSGGLKKIFGSDATRFAIALMEQGAAGFERLRDAVLGGDVAAKVQKSLEGSAAASVRIENAWKAIKLKFGLDTGFLDVVTRIKNLFAGLLESISRIPTPVAKAALVFGAFAATLGPLFLVLKGVVMLLAARVASAFGVIGQIIAFIISPLTTLFNLFVQFASAQGILFVLRMAGTYVLRLLGPVGLAISAFLAFKDYIFPVIAAFGQQMADTFGPRLTALWAKVSALFTSVQNGPIGAAIEWIIGVIPVVVDIIGTVLAGAFNIAGQVIMRVFDAVLTTIEGFVDIVQDVVDVVSALMKGDFSGAFEAAGQIVVDVVDTIIGVFAALHPEIGASVRAAYESVKEWLGQRLMVVSNYVSALVEWLVESVTTAFPGIIDAAKSVYEGIKGWLVTAFKPVMDWVGQAADFIVEKWLAVKKALGLGGGGGAPKIEGPKEPSWLDKMKAMLGGKGGGTRSAPALADKKKGGGGGGKSGPTAEELAAKREELKLETQLELARERGDHASVQRLQDQLDLRRQIDAYVDAGLTKAEATKAAEADLAAIQAARRDNAAREIADEQRMVDLEAARITGNERLAETIQREADLKDRIEFFERQLLGITDARLRKEEAIRMAKEAQAKIDAAVAEQRATWLREDQMKRDLELARLRGATDEEIRQRERVLAIEERIRELKSNTTMTDAEARAQATAEAMESEQARVQGSFRDAFKGGIYAAMDGNFGSYIKNLWKENVRKGMEQALNNLADMIFNLFSNVKIGGAGGSGGGGILGALGGLVTSVGKVFGFGGPDVQTGTPPIAGHEAVHAGAFKTGGTIRVGGMSGIDRNLIALRASKGEEISVRRAGRDMGPMSRVIIEPTPYFDAVVDGRAAGVAAPLSMRAANAGSTGAQVAMTRQRARQIP
ncbi:phage tail tape measure protein [Sphingomonas sanxanigenens]|uniref:phage tail tape measure protein n=1 Tax=Sphingomonas sanxanigenens TaxID=397260 RepID=UPI001301555B|nr:phage tail tape measure protein [Sphingomonas sanxanigenens]